MKRTLLLLVAALALLAAACGGDSPGTSDAATRTVEIAMRDIAFEPTSVEVASGETVRFVFTNKGKLAHDAFIGNSGEQATHETEMRDAEDGGHGEHGGGKDGTALTVEPGRTGTLTHTFEDRGRVEIGCHQPGHYGAGMTIDVTVA